MQKIEDLRKSLKFEKKTSSCLSKSDVGQMWQWRSPSGNVFVPIPVENFTSFERLLRHSSSYEFQMSSYWENLRNRDSWVTGFQWLIRVLMKSRFGAQNLYDWLTVGEIRTTCKIERSIEIGAHRVADLVCPIMFLIQSWFKLWKLKFLPWEGAKLTWLEKPNKLSKYGFLGAANFKYIIQ